MSQDANGFLLYGLVAILYGLSVWSLRRQARHRGRDRADEARSRIVLVGRMAAGAKRQQRAS